MKIQSTLCFLGLGLLLGCDDRTARLDELCVQGTAQDPGACSILVENVEPNRALLAGEQLDLRGYLVFRHYFMGIYPTQDHAALGLTRTAVRVRTPHERRNRDELISFNNQPVRIVGRFVDDGRVGMPEWAGSITIERIGPATLILETEVNPLIEIEPEQGGGED